MISIIPRRYPPPQFAGAVILIFFAVLGCKCPMCECPTKKAPTCGDRANLSRIVAI
jgi:hypothetical protein